MQHTIDTLGLNRNFHSARLRTEEERAEEYMKERQWLKRAFMDAVDGESEEDCRHPRYRTHYLGHWVKSTDAYSRSVRKRTGYRAYSEWAKEQISQKEPTDLTAGDTSKLDEFLSRFSMRQEV